MACSDAPISVPAPAVALDLEKHVTANLGSSWTLVWSKEWRRRQNWTGVWENGDHKVGALFVDGTDEEFNRRGRRGFPEEKYALIYVPR
ncbi:hypothetical protein KCG44_09260 [Pacificimonas sp. WHA3]|uniref:Uncharacterized protein n=1 Tax=Pacificimonas pallii TaxID=2827236 RepID=A0ABS6SEZ8_9SPHN|nr:hypothetical protein [Pacificimonas pallii]MBV7256969.1 hypothetical protein [Pacificimonas pallii]